MQLWTVTALFQTVILWHNAEQTCIFLCRLSLFIVCMAYRAVSNVVSLHFQTFFLRHLYKICLTRLCTDLESRGI